MTRATILFAHGSRDPRWSEPMEAVARRMRALDPAALVRCAYLELMQPDLAGAVTACVEGGCDDIVVVPMFLGIGRHARDDLPALVNDLSARYPAVVLRMQPAVGEDARVVDALARVALG